MKIARHSKRAIPFAAKTLAKDLQRVSQYMANRARMAMDEARPTTVRLAFDRGSVRSVDQDGRLHVSLTPISKANVCPYLGSEIPNATELGLDPDRTYQLLRDPQELAKAAASSNNIPLMSTHIPVSVNDPQKDYIIGSLGTDAVFDAPYLKNSLVVWDSEAIAAIESGEQKELSCAYRYRCDLTPGTYEGVKYDGVMREILFNHCAAVSAGRAGPDVVVGDEKIAIVVTDVHGMLDQTEPKEHFMQTAKLSRKAAMAKGALVGFLAPLMAKDAKIDLTPVLKDVNAANWKAKKPAIVSSLTAASKGKLAQDASLDGLAGLLDRFDDSTDTPDDDLGMDDPDNPAMPAVEMSPMDKMKAFLESKGMSPEDIEACMGMMPAMDEPPATPGAPDPKRDTPFAGATPKPAPGAVAKPVTSEKEKDMVSKPAMDAAIKIATDNAVKQTMKRMQDVAEARDAVRPFVGEIGPQDNAETVYKLALDAKGVDTTDVPPKAFKAMVAMLPTSDAPQPRVLASDSAANADFFKRFPAAKPIRNLG